jgi:hypothetical protein
MSTVSVCEMLRQGICVSRSLVAEGQHAVFGNVCSRVLERYNSAIAATQARPEEWDYAKPFEEIPGPKPLPIIGNAWRFIPFLGKLLFPYIIRICSLNERRLVRLYIHFVKCQILSRFNIEGMNIKLQKQYNSDSWYVEIIHFTWTWNWKLSFKCRIVKHLCTYCRSDTDHVRHCEFVINLTSNIWRYVVFHAIWWASKCIFATQIYEHQKQIVRKFL